MRRSTTPHNRRRRAAAVVAVGLLSSATAACGDDETIAANDEGVYEIPITVTHYPTLLYAVPYVVGIEKGFFAEEDIELTEIAGSEGGGTTVRNVVTGDLPIGEVATPGAAQALAQGSDVVAVGGGVQSVAEINFVTSKGKGPKSIEELAGSTVSYTSPGSVTQGVLALSLDAAGVPPKEVNSKALGGVGEGLTALDSGAVDAAANMEPIYSGDPDPFDVAFWANDHVPEFQQTVIIAGPDLVENQPELVESFLRARAKAVEWINENPAEAAALWAKEADIDEKVAQQALTTVLEDDYYGIGFSEEGLSAVDKEMQLIDLVPEGQEIPWEDLIDSSLLPEGAPAVDGADVGGEG